MNRISVVFILKKQIKSKALIICMIASKALCRVKMSLREELMPVPTEQSMINI